MDDFEYRLEATIRYHHRRIRFFQRVSTWISVGSLFGSSAAAAMLIGRPESIDGHINLAALLITSMLALVAAIGIIVRPSDKAREHQEWASKFIGLDKKRCELAQTEENYRKLLVELTELERDEPPHQRIVRVLSENDYAQARGLQGVRVSWLKEQFANIIDFRAPARENPDGEDEAGSKPTIETKAPPSASSTESAANSAAEQPTSAAGS